MKCIIFIAIGVAATGFLLAQGRVGSSSMRSSKYMTYNPNITPPPMGLAEAYTRAQATIGSATNTFYCVAADCTNMNAGGFTGWTFIYANTNGQRGRVVVFFDGQAGAVAGKGEVLIQH